MYSLALVKAFFASFLFFIKKVKKMIVKTTNSLMKYLRDKHKININGSKEKQQLVNIGYYHGYKGYRFYKHNYNKIKIKDFKELNAIVNFDMKLKSILYHQIMQIETIYKNRTLQILIEEYKTDNFNDIYDKGMYAYKEYSKESKRYIQELRHRLYVFNTIHASITKNYRKKDLVTHYLNKDSKVPLWGIFEIITLGVFADLIRSLSKQTREKISFDLDIKSQFDTGVQFVYEFVYLIKDLRNSIAHNNPIFDVRFKNNNIKLNLSQFLSYSTGISNINFDTITDYFILIVFLLNKFKISKIEINKLINDYEKIIYELKSAVSVDIYELIIRKSTIPKLKKLQLYLKK